MVIVLKKRFDDFNNGEELLKKNTIQWKKANKYMQKKTSECNSIKSKRILRGRLK